MRRLHRALRPPEGNDAGYTLAELLVAMVLTALLGVMVMQTFVQGTRAVYNADARGADTQQAKSATENISRMVRLAVDPDSGGTLRAFESATPNDVTFYANDADYPVDRAPKVRIWLDGSVIRQSVTVAGASLNWNGGTTSRVIARDVVSTGRPLFTYLTASDTSVGANGVAVTTLPNTAGSITTPENRALIGAVEIWVSIRSAGSGRRLAPTTAVTRVTLLNKK